MPLPEYYTRTGSAASIFSLAFFLMDNVANVIFFCAFCTRYWGFVNVDRQYHIYIGIWSYCISYDEVTCAPLVGNEVTPGLFLVFQCFECIIFLLAVIKTITSIFYIFKSNFCKSKKVAILISITTIATVITSVASLILFSDVFPAWVDSKFFEFPDGWVVSSLASSFYMQVSATVIYFLCAAAIVTDVVLLE